MGSEPKAHETYCSPWGNIRVLSLPPDIVMGYTATPRRKDGQFDMRYRASRYIKSAIDDFMRVRFERRAA